MLEANPSSVRLPSTVSGSAESIVETSAEPNATRLSSPQSHAEVHPPISPLPDSPTSRPATTVADWVAQIEASQVQITGVRLEPTETGLSIVLETAAGDLPTPTTQTVGNALTADIPNAVLALPEGEMFEQFGPAEGIALVSVTSLPDGGVRVSITGTDAPPQAEVSTEAGNLVLSVVPGVATAADADEAIQVIVTGEEAGSDYFVPNASSTLRTDTPIRDTPSSVQVIPQQVIEDQGATNAREVVRNAAGVNFAESAGNRDERFIIRGFEAEQFRNGFRDDFLSSATQTELANVDRVEILKGPASILFGRAEPAGIINFVTKKPLREPFYEIAFTAGSFDFYRPTLDFSGPLTENGNLAYRLNAAYENAGSFRDGVETERFFVAPTLSWEISPDTELSLEFSYLHDTRPIDRGLVVLSDDEVADIPFDTFLGDPDGRLDFDETRTELYLDHRFNSNLSLRSLIRYTTSDVNGSTIEIDGESEDDRNFPISDTRQDQSFETFTIQNDLIAKFDTGEIEHTLLFGLEYANTFFGSAPTIRTGATIDIFDPSREFIFDESGSFDFEQSSDSIGIYLQDQIALLDNLKLVVGGRFDTFSQEETFDGEVTETEADAFSPRVGIVYQPIQPVSLYASYTRSFTPVSGVNIDNEPFDPERGTGFEIGVKTEIIEDRLFSTLAFYDTTLTNVTTEDPDNPNFSVQTGEQRSRGIELDVQGEILPGWNIFAGYAYTDAEVTEDNEIPVGNRLVNVPEHNFNLWTTYTLQEGDLAGLGFGAGVFYVGERAGDLDNSFFVDDYVRVDAAIYYERENYRFALNFKNLFDAEFIEGTAGRTEVIPGAPFTVLGTVSVKF
ncbi:TonB-dependent receptor [Romeria aff. gracilis LEGE 07310]|uniref:TonB-dependent receptor n=1 Tax=Vasconcelosia minhoensis LEGE 07310 TaxID=915328 RepID=A0A8J7AV74_9CYAN|nr:TonB-dependent receptor [Romeria aff. gracilis LEGE 07310]